MLVLSRRLGESVVINDRLVLTVALLTDDHVELSLINVTGSLVGTFTTRVNDRISLPEDVQIIVIRLEDDKVRIGFDGPADSRFHRGEFWNMSR